MPEQLQARQQQLLTHTRDFVRDHLEPLSARHEDDAATLRQAVVSAARSTELFALTQPRAYGGSEAGVLDLTVVREALAVSGLPARRWVLGPGPGFLAAASGVLAERYLEPLLRGELRTAFAFTDAREGPGTVARRTDGGWLLDGLKSYVTGGADADCFGIIARIKDGEGSLFAVVDADSPGLTVGERFRSIDGSHHATLTLHGLFVADDALLGAPGSGMPRAMKQIGDTRLAMAADACGLMQYVLEHLEQHLLAPHRSGAPLADREGVRLRYAELRINAFAARSMVYRTARLADAGENVVNEGIASKVFCTETLGHLVDTAIQLEGGQALVAGHPLERLYREVRVLRLAEGASDLLRLNLARGRFELGKGRI
ncbi:MAG: acyl-CoA/acyl-ACP dehydrogenase [Gammaproteobacteria bacterium]|nr:acyl-CoA/acyl-ACP dehydrogenase [Gammaproteobacteria bacterium]